MNNDSDLYFDGNKYISAKRASQLSGYASDYISQLCRVKKLESKTIGRSWFVSEKSLSDYIRGEESDGKSSSSSSSEFLEYDKDASGGADLEVKEISSSRDDKNIPNDKSGGFTYLEDKGPLIPEIISKKASVDVMDEAKIVCEKEKDIALPSDEPKSSTDKNIEISFRRLILSGAALTVSVLIVFGAAAMKDSSVANLVKGASEKMSPSPVDFLKGIAATIKPNDFLNFENKNENGILALIKKTPSYFESGLSSSMDEAASAYNSLAGKFSATENSLNSEDKNKFLASISSSFNNFSVKVYDGANDLFSGVKNYFANLLGSGGGFATEKIIPIKRTENAAENRIAENSSANRLSQKPGSSDRTDLPHSFSASAATNSPLATATAAKKQEQEGNNFIVASDITRREVLDLIKQFDDNSKALIYAANAANGENSLMVSQTVSNLKDKVVSLERKGSLVPLQIDHVANVVSKPFSEITSLDGVAMTNSSFSGTTGTFSGNLTVGSRLIVSGTATSTIGGDANFNYGTLFVDSVNNRVGIGTTSPSDTLALNGPMYFSQISAPSVTTNRLYNNSGNLYWNGALVSPTATWGISGSDAYRSTGNVGIGTTSPASKLDVWGGLRAGTSATPWFIVDSSTGNVGIGTTSPAWKFAAAGAGSFDDYLRASYFTATSAVIASVFPQASTTQLSVAGNSWFNGLSTFANLLLAGSTTLQNFTANNSTTTNATTTSLAISGSAYLGSLNGPLQANVGLVSATTSIGYQYGGTGLTADPSFGQILRGTGSGYALVATSTLGVNTNDLTEGNNLFWTTTRFDNRLSATTSLQNITTLANLATVGTITSGTWNGTTIAVGKGGTGQTSFGQGWLDSDGTTLSASTSPTVNYITATSTTATSTFPFLSVTANSNVGTVVGGTWQGTAVGTQYGGTGQNFSASSGLINLYSGTASAMATSSLGLLTTNVAEGTNQYWTNTRFDNRLSATTSLQNITTLANLSITGSQVSNLNTLWDNRFAATSTTGLAEGNNLYWTNTRFDNRLSATTSLQNITNLANLATVGTITSGTWNGTTIAVGKGGTGWASIQSGSIPYGNGSSALSTTTAGTAGNVLALLNGIPTWTATTTLSTITGTLAVGKGGTGQTSFGQGWLDSDGTTLSASTSPTVAYLTATSTTATSTFATGGLAVGTNQFVVQQNSGNVGIGTTSPAGLLHVEGTGPINTIWRATNASQYAQFSIRNDQNLGTRALSLAYSGSTYPASLITNGPTGEEGSISTGGAYPLIFGTNNTFRVIIDSSGNVGIGTTTPTHNLTIENGSVTSVSGALRIGGTISLENAGHSIDFYAGSTNSGGAANPMARVAGVANNTGSYGELSFYTNAGLGGSAATEALRITGTGSVGIGTTSPNWKFSAAGAGSFDDYLRASYFTATSTTATSTFAGGMSVAGSSGLTVLQNGNVGIGTMSPGNTLHVVGSIRGTTGLYLGTGGRFIDSITDTGIRIYDGSDYAIQMTGGNTNVGNGALYVKNGGNVGIGTTSPTDFLHIQDATNSKGITIDNTNTAANSLITFQRSAVDQGYIGIAKSNGVIIGSGLNDLAIRSQNNILFAAGGAAENMRIGTNGKVGIGTTSPNAQLHVDGSIFSSREYNDPTSGSGIFMSGGLNPQLVAQSFNTGTYLDVNLYEKNLNILLQAGGGVGIGTTNPTNPLTVATNPSSSVDASILISPTTNTNASLIYMNNGGNGGFYTGRQNSSGTSNLVSGLTAYQGVIGNSGALPLSLITNSAARMTIDSVGNIGIGTSSPLVPLDIFRGAVGPQLRIAGNAVDGNDASMDFAAFNGLLAPSYGRIGVNVQTASAGVETGGLFFSTINSGTLSQKMAILGNGNVAIGTTTPAVVYGNRILTIGASSYPELELQASPGNGGRLGNVIFTNGVPSTGGAVAITANLNSGVTTDAYLAFHTGHGLTTGLLPPEAMRIDSSGNVGIKTTSPIATLQVSASGSYLADSTNSGITVSNAGTPSEELHIGVDSSLGADGSAYIQSIHSGVLHTSLLLNPTGGPVGIGTTSPASLLTLHGPAPILTLGDIQASSREFQIRNGSVAAGKLDIYDLGNATSRLTIDGSGNVGIGTANPGFNFATVGTGAFAYSAAAGNEKAVISPLSNGGQLVMYGANNSTVGIVLDSRSGNSSYFNNGGSVGIGTSSPATLLEVGGATTNVTFDGYKNCAGFTSNANGLLACTASDERLKQNIVSLDGSSGLSALNALNPVSFYWKDASLGTQQQYGLIAQQVKNVFPNLVQTTNPTALTPDGTLTVNYYGLIAPMIKSIQELDGRTRFIANSATSTVLAVDAAGNVGIGTTTPAYKLHIIGDVAATSFVNISTKTAKKDISYITSSQEDGFLDKIKNINIAQYRYDIEDENSQLRLGLIAEEAPSEVLSASGKGVDIYKMTSFALAGVKAMQREIDKMKIDISALSATTTASQSSGVISQGLQWIVDQFSSALGIAFGKDRMQAKTVAVESFEMKDSATGETYCVKISNGDWNKTKGVCGAASSSSSSFVSSSISSAASSSSSSLTISAASSSSLSSVGSSSPVSSFASAAASSTSSSSASLSSSSISSSSGVSSSISSAVASTTSSSSSVSSASSSSVSSSASSVSSPASSSSSSISSSSSSVSSVSSGASSEAVSSSSAPSSSSSAISSSSSSL